MAKKDGISLSVIKRLPRYYRFLGMLLRDGVTRISSKELAQRMKLTASQIRQDLNCFGGFGQQGYGYNVESLHQAIGKILGLQRHLPIILVGAGNLGKAIARQMDFDEAGFELIGIFDKSPDVVGRTIRGLTVRDAGELESFCITHHPEVAILTIPQEYADSMARMLVSRGIKGFWNFTTHDISHELDPNIVVENVHLCDSLMTLCYQVNDQLFPDEE